MNIRKNSLVLVDLNVRLKLLESTVNNCIVHINGLQEQLNEFYRLYVDKEGLLTYKEIQAVFKLHHSTVQRWVARGYIKPYLDTKNKQLYRFKRADIEALIKKKRNG